MTYTKHISEKSVNVITKKGNLLLMDKISQTELVGQTTIE